MWYRIEIPDILDTPAYADMTEEEAAVLLERFRALDDIYEDVLEPSHVTIKPITETPDIYVMIENYIAATIEEGDRELERWKDV